MLVKLKFILSTLIFVLAATVAASQVVTPTLAHNKPPVTSPITSPISAAMVQLSGAVKYLNHFHFDPAAGAKVMAQNKDTHNIFTATADSSGKYSLSLPKGKYHVWAEGTGSFATDKFVPNISSLKLLFNLHLDFFGLPKH